MRIKPTGTLFLPLLLLLSLFFVSCENDEELLFPSETDDQLDGDQTIDARSLTTGWTDLLLENERYETAAPTMRGFNSTRIT